MTQEHPIEEALRLAALTAEDGEERALDVRFGGSDALVEMRTQVRDELATLPAGDPRRFVLPWRWQQDSGGEPLTRHGAETGLELHFSRYAEDQYENGTPQRRATRPSSAARTAPSHTPCRSCHVLKPRDQLTESGCVDCD